MRSSSAGTSADTRAPEPDRQQRRVLRTLVGAQILSGAGLAAGVSVGALLAEDMLHSEGLAGLPSALFTIGSAGAAVLVGRVSGRHGRRRGLGLGYGAGAIGAVLVVLAATLGSVALLLPALLIYGAGTATNMQARYAGADLAPPEHAGRAISIVLVATTIGAVIGPNAVSTMGDLADRVGIPRLSGPFILAAVAYGFAGLVLIIWLRPDPLLLARERESAAHEQVRKKIGDTEGPPQEQPSRVQQAVMLGGFIMVVAQLVMVAIMTMTPVHMRNHGHGLGPTGAVIAAHIAGMYLPSPVTGMLVDRFGARSMALASGVTLALSGVLAATVPSTSVIGLALALTVLGIGWNFGLLSGTALVTQAVPLATRARTQGAVDLAIAVAGAGGGLGSGIVTASTSYPTLALLGAGISVVVVPIVAMGARSQPSARGATA